jgi:hypothetical protein
MRSPSWAVWTSYWEKSTGSPSDYELEAILILAVEPDVLYRDITTPLPIEAR